MSFVTHIEHMRKFDIERLWKLARFNPNEQQREAILHVEGPLYLTAGPGSGKTRVLLWRTLNLIVFHDVRPEQIFLSTFTEKAAFQLKEGLRTLLGLVTNLNQQPYDLSPMYVGTVHSLCERILADRRRFFVDRQRTRPPQLLDDLSQYFHLYKNRNWNSVTEVSGLADDANTVINSIFDDNSESKHVAVTNCISIFNRLSEECITASDALQLIEDGDSNVIDALNQQHIPPESLILLLRLYAGYQETLLNRTVPLTDFSLVQQEAYRILENYEHAGSVFQHVIVDEYQDTNTIQERLFFKLASGTGNICVVGDDDQALYRFRGATVENFVQFPVRCQGYLGLEPRRIPLSINYRSRKNIVDFYTNFIVQHDWAAADGSGAHYRVVDKDIKAHRSGDQPCVVASTPDTPLNVCTEIASLVKRLLDEGKVRDPNQIAFLFPSMKFQGQMTSSVSRMKDALEALGLQVYAPRASRFLEVDEALDVIGVFTQIFGRAARGDMRGRDYQSFHDWLDLAEQTGAALVHSDPQMAEYVQERREELDQAVKDYRALMKVVEQNHWHLDEFYDINRMKRPLAAATELSKGAQQLIVSTYFDRIVNSRIQQGRPFNLEYVIKRSTSINWSVLDLFYRLCGFDHFRHMFDLAETGQDEGPISNLGLISEYLARFIDEYVSVITAELLDEGLFQRMFFAVYLYVLYRRGESENENPDDPFPRGRIPFLTVHQAKGLEFPVVVLANPRKDDRGPNKVEMLVRPLLDRHGSEPIDRMSGFDAMRMFYVALSRAKNLLVVAHYRGQGQRINEPFRTMLDNNFPRIPDLDIDTIPNADLRRDFVPKVYTFTADFLMYRKCPRQYMIFRKYRFVPSRSQTMFFGSLVHRTLEDLHHELIRRRQHA